MTCSLLHREPGLNTKLIRKITSNPYALHQAVIPSPLLSSLISTNPLTHSAGHFTIGLPSIMQNKYCRLNVSSGVDTSFLLLNQKSIGTQTELVIESESNRTAFPFTPKITELQVVKGTHSVGLCFFCEMLNRDW